MNHGLQHERVSVGRALRALTVATWIASAGSAGATELDLGIENAQMRWDNTLRLNSGIRVQGKDSAIANSTTYDESDNRFGPGSFVTNRADLLSEADFVYEGKHGLRVSGAFWYDAAYGPTAATASGVIPSGATGAGLPYSSVGSYVNDQYTSTTKNYYAGPYGELLDAFAFGTFEVAGRPVSVKAGRHSIYWGESLFSPIHGVSYSQQPSDLRKAQATPGSEAKELFLPLTAVSAAVQLTDSIAVAGQYFLEWQPFRVPEGGTYLAGSDIALEGPQRTLAAVSGGNPVFMDRIESVQPNRWGGGDFGVSLKWRSDWFGTVGAYFRRFDEKLFWLLRGTPPAASLTYRAVFPTGTILYGLSMSQEFGGASVGAEVVYRVNTGLQTQAFAVSDEGARGNTLHGILNAAYVISQTRLFSSASVSGEVVYNTYTAVTKNRELFNAVGYTPCNNRRVSDGCATKDFVGTNLSFTPTWLQVFPGGDLSMPLTLGIGVYGNSSVLAGGNQGAGSYSAGLGLDYHQRYRFDLKYIGYMATHNVNPTTGVVSTSNGTQIQDRGWVALTFKTSI